MKNDVVLLCKEIADDDKRDDDYLSPHEDEKDDISIIAKEEVNDESKESNCTRSRR